MLAGLGAVGVAFSNGGCTAQVGEPGGGAAVVTGGSASPDSPGGGGASPSADGGSQPGRNDGGSGGGGGGGSKPGVLVSPFARLSRVEYQATIKAAFGVEASTSGIPDDSRVGPFTSNVSVLPDPAGTFMLASEDLAALIVPSKIPACTAANAATCIPRSYQGPIEKLYRRTLAPAELTAFATLLTTLEKAGVTSEEASRRLISSVLMSPDFLFRVTPIGGAPARAQQLAEQLSYALWDAPPDVELASAAQASPADLGARLRDQAVRLSKDPRAVTPLARFLAQWLRVDVDNHLDEIGYEKSPLYLELSEFVKDSLANNVPVTSFVNGKRGFVHKDNFDKYGLSASTSSSPVVAVTWPANSARRGVLGEELLIDATRHPDPSRRSIFRGHLVQSSLLCNDIPPPPPELQALAGEVSDRTADPRCKTCHLLMEPVGAAFAALDSDHTGAIPPAVLNGSDEVGGTYPDIATLLDKIAPSQAYADCFARHLLGFFLEQDPTLVEDAAVADIASIVKSGGGFGDAVAQLIVSLEARSKSVTPWCAAP